MTDMTIPELLIKLAEWGNESHDRACAGLVQCRHDRAKEAIVQINNAIAEMEWEQKAASKGI